MNLKTIRKSVDKFDQKLYTALASKSFLYVILILFGLSAAWVATTSLYPMAFDENVHIGIITIYSQYLLPVLSPSQDMAQYNGVVADPSYLFHYLMSFPYRIERDVLQMSETASIIGLRFINIGLFIAGLVIFWRGLSLLGLSRFTRNIIIALCCLIPISPLLAGQVNYDNLLMLEVALCFLFTLRVLNSLKQKNRIPAVDTGLLLLALLAGAATKYAFLPIAVAIVAIIIGVVILSSKRKETLHYFAKEFSALKTPTKIVLITLICLGGLLNMRYPSNLINYQDVSPKCDKFFSVEACRDFGPYGRNYNLKNKLDSTFEPKNTIAYVVEDWIPGLSYRLFFTVAGPTNGYATREPVLLPVFVYSIGIIVGVMLFLWRNWKKSLQDSVIWLLLSIIGIYCLSLLAKLYGSYIDNGVAVALNGRYLIPIAPLIGAIIALGAQGIRYKKRLIGLSIVTSIILAVLVIEGGGIGTYIVHGQPEWFWQGWGQESHRILQNMLDPIILK